MGDYVTLRRIQTRGRSGISSSSGGRVLFSPGIGDPLCGWAWLLGRAHPEVELSFTLDMGGSRFSGTFRNYKPGLVAKLARAAR